MTRSIGTAVLRLALALSVLVPSSPVGADFSGIVVEVEALRSDAGQVRVAVFPESGWVEEGRQIATCHTAVHHGHAMCVITDVRPGTYAIAVLHDEDDDGGLDRNFLGLPSEGFGFSNDAPTGLGPPSFHDASFRFEGGETDLVVHARYGL
jgi:uncharacterized protein (DUF2141 family)